MQTSRCLISHTSRLLYRNFHFKNVPKCVTLLPENFNLQSRSVSTCKVNQLNGNESLLEKVLYKVPFLNYNKIKLRAAGYLLYETIADKVDYVSFFEQFDLADTFYSWFTVTELYIWMIATRLMAEGDDGRFLRNSIIEALWSDVAVRVKKLGASNPSGMRHHIQELSQQLQAALIAYDEGLQSDDVILAGALWRRIYQMDAADPESLEKMVEIVRKQVQSLDQVTWDELVVKRNINWLPVTSM